MTSQLKHFQQRHFKKEICATQNVRLKDLCIEDFKVTSFQIPTEKAVESDGTIEWNSTTLNLVEIKARDFAGIGYSYGHRALALYAEELLAHNVLGKNAFDIASIWGSLTRAVRNDGRQGLSAMAISAIDCALWDLKAKILKCSLVDLLGAVREKIEIYGSGGFTSFSHAELKQQFESWKKLGIRRFKMKVGTHPERDAERVHFAKQIIGENAELMVDANEAYSVSQAIALAQDFHDEGVSWFEQPIHSMNFTGMKELRKRLPVGMKLATGEYIYEESKLLTLIASQSADIIQLDVTRCQGVTGFLKYAAVCEAHHLAVSSHCAPSLHLALGCALPNMQHIEYFSDHARIENLIFEESPAVEDGFLKPQRDSYGFGLNLKSKEKIKKWQI